LAELSLYDLGRWFVRHVRAIMVGAVLGCAILVARAFMVPRTYTSSASFLPQSGSSEGSRLGMLAAQFGVVLGGGSNQSPAFYADLLKSHELLGTVVDARYPHGSEPADSATLVSIFEIRGGSRPQQQDRAIRQLADAITVITGRETGIVRVNVKLGSSQLAQQVASRILQTLNDYNLRIRQEQAIAERTFARERLDEVMAELRAAEGRLEVFQRQNRVYNSPDLSAQNQRLQRDISMRQQIYMSMEQEYEQARIDAVRSTPVISVLEHASYPAYPDSRRALQFAFVGLIVGGTLGALFAAVRDRRSTA